MTYGADDISRVASGLSRGMSNKADVFHRDVGRTPPADQPPLGEPDPEDNERTWEDRFDALHALVLDWAFKPCTKSSMALRMWIEGNHALIMSPEMVDTARRHKAARDAWTRQSLQTGGAS